MKLRKLTIKNLASIEEATINFTEGPLAEESIFLICGETGSGKSTLLDAICLALYKDTPRMKQTNREAYHDASITVLDSVQTNDCRQLVRRNAKEASVVLSFEDNDGIGYTATWSVSRTRTGNLKKVEWSLHNHASDEVWNKDPEIKAEILRIIGLDFEQFCRTTMLAQGEFTRFLQSNANEKADILERLTTTDIYSQIGTQIYEKWKYHKAIYDNQKAKSETIQPLPEDERKLLTETISNKEKEIETIIAQQSKVTQKIQWFASERTLVQNLTTAEKAYQSTLSSLNSEGFKEAEKLLERWNISTNARNDYKEGLRIQQQLKDNETDRSGVEDKIRQLHPQCPEQISEVLPMLKQEEESIRIICRSTQAVIHELQTEMQQQEKQLKFLNIDQQEKRKDNLLIQNERLQALQGMFVLLEEKEKQQQELSAEKSRLEKLLQDCQTSIIHLSKELDTAENLSKAQERRVENLKNATKDWAKEARRKLKEGDQCPVCGRQIEQLLDDENFYSILEGPEKEWEDLKKNEEIIRQQYNQKMAEKKQSEHSLDIAKFKQQENQKAYATLQEKINNVGKALQLEKIDSTTITTRIADNKQDIETINEILKTGKERSMAIASLQKALNGKQKELQRQSEQLHTYDIKIKTFQTLNERLEEIRKYQDELNELSRQIQTKIKEFLEAHSFTSDTLRQLSSYPEEKVEDMRKRMQQTREDIVKKETALNMLKKDREILMQSKPEMEADETSDTLEALRKTLEQQLKEGNQAIGQWKQRIVQDDLLHKQKEEEIHQEKTLYQSYLKWNRLKELFGSADGKTFRAIAQSFILKDLLHNANYYLKHFTDRYQLEGQGISLTILLRDYYEGGVTRPVSTLSGGESFLVSLALALGLSSFNRQHLSVDTLFIDEGFGTLSSDYLNTVMDTLEKLHQLGGKKVGIISHVEGLRERIRTQIQVKRLDNSRSEVVIVS